MRSGCVRSLAAIAKLETRIAALETEVTGPPAEVILEQSKDFMARSNARWAREADERRRAKYEAFMRERGLKS